MSLSRLITFVNAINITFVHERSTLCLTIFLFATSFVCSVENSLLLLGEAVNLFHDDGEEDTTGEAEAREEIEGAFLTQSVEKEI